MTPTTPTLPTSTFADLALAVRAIFAAPTVGEPAEVLFGKKHVRAEGAPRRVVFVPDRGKVSKKCEISRGYVGTVEQGGTIYIWGAPAADGDDFESTRDADALFDRVWNAIVRAGYGIVDGDTIADGGKPDDDAYGYTYALHVVASRGIQRDAAIASLKRLTSDPVSPPDPQRPPGAESYAATVVTEVSSTTA